MNMEGRRAFFKMKSNIKYFLLATGIGVLLVPVVSIIRYIVNWLRVDDKSAFEYMVAGNLGVLNLAVLSICLILISILVFLFFRKDSKDDQGLPHPKNDEK